jgi:hypothetical protein
LINQDYGSKILQAVSERAGAQGGIVAEKIMVDH